MTENEHMEEMLDAFYDMDEDHDGGHNVVGSMHTIEFPQSEADKEEQNMAATLFSTEFREEMDAAGQKKAFEDTVRKVKQASIEQRIEQAVETGDMERFQALLTEKNRYKNQFPIPD